MRGVDGVVWRHRLHCPLRANSALCGYFAVPSLSYLDALPKGVDKLGKKCFDNIEVLRQVDKGVDDSIAVPSRPPLDAFDQPIICIERSM